MKSTTALAAFLCLASACAASPPPPPDPPPPRTVVGPVPLPEVEVVSIERCGDTAEGFDDWIASFSRHAIGQGIASKLVVRVLANVAYDDRVIELDRAQRKKTWSFDEFARSHVTPSRIQRGKARLATHADLLSKITTRFGVPKEIIVAIWGLETDFGENLGSTPSLRALATLAYDCRRAERFRGELASALRVLQRGDLSVDAMVGARAGEFGQTQFLPSSYERFGIDFDGDGRADIVGSTDDALASTAHYLAEHGWRAGEGYAPDTHNFTVLGEWNKSESYLRTIVLFASKLR